MSVQPPPAYSGTPVPKTSGLAIWSLVLGILSLTCFSIFSAIPGVICGHSALSRIKRSAGALEGKGLAIGGLITGYLGIACSLLIIPLMLAIAIPNFVKARQTSQTRACIGNLNQIEDAKKAWALQNGKQPTDVPTLTELFPNAQPPKCPADGQYNVNAVADQATCSIDKHQLEPIPASDPVESPE
jgi:competence protein ComGC